MTDAFSNAMAPTRVFVAGSISIKRVHLHVTERLGNIVAQGFEVLVGDADGADAAVQKCLCALPGAKVTVFHTGDKIRHNLGAWPTHSVRTSHRPGTRAFFTAKDLHMAAAADYGLMLWDCESPGTLSNVIELLSLGKKSVVFLDAAQSFKTIANAGQLQSLVDLMSVQARRAAEQKIGILERLVKLQQEPQLTLA